MMDHTEALRKIARVADKSLNSPSAPGAGMQEIRKLALDAIHAAKGQAAEVDRVEAKLKRLGKEFAEQNTDFAKLLRIADAGLVHQDEIIAELRVALRALVIAEEQFKAWPDSRFPLYGPDIGAYQSARNEYIFAKDTARRLVGDAPAVVPASCVGRADEGLTMKTHDELIAARIELARLRKRTGNQRRALRQLNRAHATLWQVVRIQAEGQCFMPPSIKSSTAGQSAKPKEQQT
jgi:hypothetical protein